MPAGICIAHVKVDFIPLQKMYVIPMLGRFVWTTSFVQCEWAPKLPEITFLPGVAVIWKSYSLNMGDKNRAEQCQKKISRETSDLPKRKTCCQVLITYRLRNLFMPKLSYKRLHFKFFDMDSSNLAYFYTMLLCHR